MLDFLKSLENKLEPHEEDSFIIRIISLNSNIIYWTKRLKTHPDEIDESKFEINRCNSLLAKVMKDLKKIEARE